MGRSLRSTVPNLPATLKPKWSFLHNFRKKEKQIKSREKLNFDKRHNVRNLPSLKNDSCDGYYQDLRRRIVGPSEQPRSYVVDISGRSPVVRNRKFLKPCIENEGEQSTENLKPDNCNVREMTDNDNGDSNRYVTSSGRISKPLDRLQYDKF